MDIYNDGYYFFCLSSITLTGILRSNDTFFPPPLPSVFHAQIIGWICYPPSSQPLTLLKLLFVKMRLISLFSGWIEYIARYFFPLFLLLFHHMCTMHFLYGCKYNCDSFWFFILWNAWWISYSPPPGKSGIYGSLSCSEAHFSPTVKCLKFLLFRGIDSFLWREQYSSDRFTPPPPLEYMSQWPFFSPTFWHVVDRMSLFSFFLMGITDTFPPYFKHSPPIVDVSLLSLNDLRD